MDLKKYYEKIIDEIKSFNFKIIEITEPAPEKISPHLEAINYIIYDWNKDHKDDRDLDFEYVIQPATDIDMNEISFDDFFNFITKIKTDENIIIETRDIEIVKFQEPEIEPEIEIITEIEIEPEKTEIKIETKIEENVDDFWDSEIQEKATEIKITIKSEDINKDVDMDFWE